MSVARSSTRAVLGDDLDTGEGLDGRAGGCDARDGLQLREQLVRRSLELHDEYLSEEEVIGAVNLCMTAEKAGGCGCRHAHEPSESVSRACRHETVGHGPNGFVHIRVLCPAAPRSCGRRA